MKTAKKILHSKIDQMTDEEASRILESDQRFQDSCGIPQTLRRLAHDASFIVPTDASKGFAAVNPIQGKGIAASEVLIRDRR